MSGAFCALLVATAAACGNEAGDGDDAGNATDTATSESSPSETTPSTGNGGEAVVGETVEPGQAVIVSASNVEGETTTRASALVNEKAVDRFLATTDQRLAADVRSAVQAAEVPPGSTLFGAVVLVGCDTPTAVSWVSTFEGIEVTPILPKSEVQCLVPVTSVALFLVPNTVPN